MTAIQMKYLIELLEQTTQGRNSVARVARVFNVNRSTVTRAMGGFIEEGVLDVDYQLTAYGKMFFANFMSRYKKINLWLRRHGVSEEAAGEDALQIMVNCSQETLLLAEQLTTK